VSAWSHAAPGKNFLLLPNTSTAVSGRFFDVGPPSAPRPAASAGKLERIEIATGATRRAGVSPASLNASRVLRFTTALRCKGVFMAKGQKRTNREAKKPKQVKVASPVVASDNLRSNLSSAPPTKKRT
jgi:hypothetical protein